MRIFSTTLRNHGHAGERLRVRTFAIAIAMLTCAISVSSEQRAQATPASPWFGVLQPPSAGLERLADAGVTRAVLSVSWASYEPAKGTFSAAYLQQVKDRAAKLSANGMGIVLDVGLQYPPSWVFSLPGQTRFQDQYGQTWHAPLGSDVPNGVFNAAVRHEQAAYISRLGSDLSGLSVLAVRVGGLLQNELRYPPAHYGRSANSLWMFDKAGLAGSPHPTWHPGAGTVAQASAMLAYYNQSLTQYERFLLQQFGPAFPKTKLEVLLPGWGLRPGQVQAAAAGRASGKTIAERGNDIANGTDWPAQVAAAANFSNTRTEIYTTWLDALGWGTTTERESPVEYLAALAKPYNLSVSGENTGTQTAQAMSVCTERVRTLHLSGMMWMQGGALLGGGPVSLANYSSKIAALRNSLL